MTKEQYEEATFFFDRAMKVFDQILEAAQNKDWERFKALKKEHELLRRQHKLVRSESP